MKRKQKKSGMTENNEAEAQEPETDETNPLPSSKKKTLVSPKSEETSKPSKEGKVGEVLELIR